MRATLRTVPAPPVLPGSIERTAELDLDPASGDHHDLARAVIRRRYPRGQRVRYAILLRAPGPQAPGAADVHYRGLYTRPGRLLGRWWWSERLDGLRTRWERLRRVRAASSAARAHRRRSRPSAPRIGW